ncbi:hypothetical protein GGI22_001498 [Coemansia erecta]|nr:hypothetical protein GGI22_001498 [Coemansia erecta]
MSDNGIVVPPEWAPGSHNYKLRGVATMGLGIAYTVFALATTVMLLVLSRNKRSGLEKQSIKLLIIQSLGCYFVGVDGLATAALNNWACFCKLWLFNIGFAMSLGAMSARAFHLFVVYRVHDLTSKLAACNPELLQPVDPIMASVHENSRLTVTTLVPRISGLCSVDDTDCASEYQRCKLEQQLHKHYRLMRFTTDRALLLYVGILLLFVATLTAVINATDKQFAIRPLNIYCRLQWGFIPGLAIISVYFFLVFPLILWRLWRYNDAYGIRNDLIICDTVGSVVMILIVVWNTSLLSLRPVWPGFFFIWLYALLIHTSSVFVPLVNAIRHIRRADAGDTAEGPSNGLGLSSRRVDFNLMLNDVAEYKRFRTFAASCFSSQLTSFLEEYQMLKSRMLALLEFQKTRDTKGTSPAKQKAFLLCPPCVLDDSATQTTRLSQIIVNTILSQDMDFTETFERNKTSINVSILDSVIERHPDIDQVSLVFPPQLAHKIKRMYRDFVDPSSLTSVGASMLVVRRVSHSISTNNFHIALLDELKDEVLLMLYCDVYTRYAMKSAGV